MLEWGVQVQSQMHPFFQPRRDQQLSGSTTGDPRCAAEFAATGGATVVDTNGNDEGSGKGKEHGSLQLDGATEVINTDVDYVDPNHDRRKRRRTASPKDETLHIEQVTQQTISTDGKHENSYETTDEPTESLVHNDNQEDGKGYENTTTTSPKTPRRSKRISSISISPPGLTVAPITNLDGRALLQKQNAPQTSPNVKTKSTPKKKSMRLTANGTLETSPKPSTKASTPKKLLKKNAAKLNLKSGRIVSSLVVSLSYKECESGQNVLGQRITNILRNEDRLPMRLSPRKKDGPNAPCLDQVKKATHPFFLGKAAGLSRNNSSHSIQTTMSVADDIDDGKKAKVDQAKPWNEIKFGSLKPTYSKDAALTSAPWPPTGFQHVAPSSTPVNSIQTTILNSKSSKRKGDLFSVTREEDILEQFNAKLHRSKDVATDVKVPDKLILTGPELLHHVDEQTKQYTEKTDNHPIFNRLRDKLQTTQTAFDRGCHAGPLDWTHEHGPSRVAEVFQPEAVALYEWLEKLKVHHVQAKLAEAKKAGHRHAKKKARPKKKFDKLDDFITYSDEEDELGHAPVKNAIVICGPTGCGKTASVYAAAHELGFEVFEIHSAMRRTAKDIFDKVGDMTGNHLVQPAGGSNRASNILREDAESITLNDNVPPAVQGMMTSFLGPKAKQKHLQTTRSETPQSETERSQKQSLILFEEVDVLFEEDKTFWAGVQSLIQLSKRPIILTCNDLSALPLDELQLHTILRFSTPPTKLAVPYLGLVAGIEGHHLSPEALEELYLSKGQDLRASLMQLNFWCQMTVGSKLGGLDWMRPARESKSEIELRDTRTISKGTYHGGLALIAEPNLEQESLLEFAQDQLELETTDWELYHNHELELNLSDKHDQLQRLDDAFCFADARSCMDVFDSSISPLLSTSLDKAVPGRSSVSKTDLMSTIRRVRSRQSISASRFVSAFEGVTDDVRTFPPPTGRTAPSVDSATQSLAVDVAPYVRAIVAFDLRLEEQRSQLAGGSQGKRSRTTRAARAALEGGSKESTRRERWFPKELDFDSVLQTGNNWPTIREDVDFASLPESPPMTE